MRKAIRQAVIQHLWQTWRDQSSDMQRIENALVKRGCGSFVLDHFAVIDLPSAYSGIPALKQLFSAIGFQEQGCGYLPDKQNDFLWMAEEDSAENHPHATLPQVVVADFRLHELPLDVRKIIEKYVALTNVAPNVTVDEHTTPERITENICHYLLQGRTWPLPTVKEFLTVHHFNELLAWVLVFGRKPNHFTISVHLLPDFKSLSDFNLFIEQQVGLPLNTDGGLIKGNPTAGIAQSSTKGRPQKIQLADGEAEIPADFIEFVWRYPVSAKEPVRWNDYFTGFVAQHADLVIESLYKD